MAGNNFKQLYEEEERLYEANHDHKIRSNLWGTLGLFRLMGDLIDVFLPRVFDIFVMASGGGRGDNSPAGPLRGRDIPSANKPSDPRKIAPKAPGEDEER